MDSSSSESDDIDSDEKEEEKKAGLARPSGETSEEREVNPPPPPAGREGSAKRQRAALHISAGGGHLSGEEEEEADWGLSDGAATSDLKKPRGINDAAGVGNSACRSGGGTSGGKEGNMSNLLRAALGPLLLHSGPAARSRKEVYEID